VTADNNQIDPSRFPESKSFKWGTPNPGRTRRNIKCTVPSIIENYDVLPLVPESG
jgi:hypothetical protein